MVLVVPVVLQLGVVDGIEECHAGHGKLEEGCNASTLGENVLVLPAPPGTANGTNNGIWWLVAASEPGTQLTQLHLAEGNISCGCQGWKQNNYIKWWMKIVKLPPQSAANYVILQILRTFAVEAGWIVRSMHLWVIFSRIVTNTHLAVFECIKLIFFSVKWKFLPATYFARY